MEPGAYRLFLESIDDEDWVVVYVHLDTDGNFGDGPQPHLVKALWEGYTHYGEFKYTSRAHNLIVWAGDAVDSATELLSAPVRLGSVVRIYEGDDPDATDGYSFRVRHLHRL